MRRILGMLLVVSMLLPFVPAAVTAAGANDYLLRAESFADGLGTWTISSDNGSLDGVILFGHTDEKPQDTRPAHTVIQVENPGEYAVWVRIKDFASQSPGARYCTLKIGDGFEQVAGKHGKNGYQWEKIGTAHLKAGEQKIELIDSSAFFCRMDSIFLTDDLNFTPPNTIEELVKLAPVELPSGDNTFGEQMNFPAYAKEDGERGQSYTLENDQVKYIFSEVATSGGTVIKRSAALKQDGQELPALTEQDDFGYLIIQADDSNIVNYNFYSCPAWDNTILLGGQELKRDTGDIFKSGKPNWLVLTGAEQTGDNEITLSGSNDAADFTAVWRLDEGAREPQVTCTMTVKQAGFYTLGMFNGPSFPIEQVDYLLAPYAFVDHFLPPIAAVVSEVASTNASSQVTVKENTLPGIGGKLTYKLTIDPESIPYRWAYTDNQKFTLGIRGMDGGAQAYAFAPVLGMQESQMAAGQSYTVKYRPTLMAGEWYDAYRHGVTEIFQLKDVRKNYYSSVNDAIFNIQDLILDDQHVGWNDKAMGFANMEIKGNYKQPTPLTVVSQYLLTEDDEMLERRALPTLAYMLTRPREDFYIAGSDQPLLELGGSPSMYSSNIFAGLYYMSRGQVPAFRQLGITSEYDYSTTGQIPKFGEYLYRYNMTGDSAALELARTEADRYIDQKLRGRRNDPNGAFYPLDGYPYYSFLLDLYEVTGEKKYLDAAAEAGHQLITSTWTQPMIPDSSIKIDSQWIKERGFWNDRWKNTTYFWSGLTRQRLGNDQPFTDEYIENDMPSFHYMKPESDRYGEYKLDPDKEGVNGPADHLERITDDEVPAWVTSRIGWGVEGSSSYFNQDSTNIPMASWAGDFVRLAQYTGDELFETMARHEVVGRAANYPGYYIGKDMTHYMQADYPYVGPDTTNIYYHHIPVYLGMLQDFLFAQTWKWSQGKVNFPAVRQYGYVWFDNRTYGFAPGTFFDHDGIWPVLKRGALTVSDMQVDWLAAKKDGVFGAALMNEDTQDKTVTVTLGSDVPSGYAGAVTVYQPNGETSTVQAENGSFTVTVPAKALVGFALQSSGVAAPAFAQVDFAALSGLEAGSTMVRNDKDGFGSGYVLQIDPNRYSAYVYAPFTPDKASKMTIHYSIGGQSGTKVVDTYPFEAILPVEDPTKDFSYDVEMVMADGSVKKTSQTQVLKPLGQ